MKLKIIILFLCFLMVVSITEGYEKYKKVDTLNPFEKTTSTNVCMTMYGYDITVDGVFLNPGDTLSVYSTDGILHGAKVLRSPSQRLRILFGVEHTVLGLLQIKERYDNSLFYAPKEEFEVYSTNEIYPGDTLIFMVNDHLVKHIPPVVFCARSCIVRLENFESFEERCILRGDLDNSGQVNVADLTRLQSFLYLNGSIDCLVTADIDNSGTVDEDDFVYLINYLWKGGPAPVPCE